MSGNLWLACCAEAARGDLVRAVRSLEPEAEVHFEEDPQAMRLAFREEEPGAVGAAVGMTERGVSDINLAAALVSDGLARKVVLVGRGPSGSERSRAQAAGVTLTVDVDALPARREGALSVAPDGAKRRYGDGRRQSAPSMRAGEGSTALEMKQGAPVLAVSSGRGGVGKTAIVATAAMVAASWGMRVAAVDLDLACGNLFTCFGLPHGAALDGVPEGDAPDEMDWGGIGVAAAEGVTLWGPCSRPERAERAAPLVMPLLDAAAFSCDLVLVDTSATCTDATAQAFQRCSRLLLVHPESAVKIGSLARVSALAVRLGVARTRIVRVANHGDRRRHFDRSVGRGEAGLETARAYRVLEGGYEVGELLAEGNVAELARLDSDFTASVAQALAQILEELGCLPAAEAANRALEDAQPRKKHFAIGRKKAS